MFIICDIDGVLASITHLLPLIQGENKDFDAYYSRIGEALPIQEGLRIADALLFTLYEDGVRDKFHFVTGRSEHSRGTTEDWLIDNLNWLGFDLHMRSNTDRRPAHEVKHDIIQRISKETGVPFNKMTVFEDDPQCAKMYESLGCYVCHVRHEKAKS
jgi:hypothetical protein